MDEKEKKELLDAFYNITAAESPREMYEIAIDVLDKYNIDPAPMEG